MSNKTMWTVEQVASELNISKESAAEQLKEAPSFGGSYLIADVIDAINPSLSTLRKDERVGRTRCIKFRNQILKCEQIEISPLFKEVSSVHDMVFWALRAAATTPEERESIHSKLHDCLSVLDDIAKTYEAV